MDSYKQYLKFLKLPYLSPCLKLRNKLCLDKLRPHKLRLYKLRPASKLNKKLRSKKLCKKLRKKLCQFH